MLDLYYWPTGNGKKITIMLEECALPYRVIPVNINKGDQHTPEYEAINPNRKMPAIVDPDVEGEPMVIFESGAILEYLGEKTGRFLPRDTRGKYRGPAVGVLAGRRARPDRRPGAPFSPLCAAEDRVRDAPVS